MESRLNGTKKWREGISELIGKGLNEGLANKLMAEGTASYEKVQAMLEWSESEISRANSYPSFNVIIPSLLTSACLSTYSSFR